MWDKISVNCCKYGIQICEIVMVCLEGLAARTIQFDKSLKNMYLSIVIVHEKSGFFFASFFSKYLKNG